VCSQNEQLPRFYNEILNHPNTSDDLRRATESKLLRHRQRYLYAIPVSGESAPLKTRIAGELESLVDGIVLLGIPDLLAWNLFINSKDCETIGTFGGAVMLYCWGADALLYYRGIRLFDASGVSGIISKFPADGARHWLFCVFGCP
jgi:hypothetical protein